MLAYALGLHSVDKTWEYKGGVSLFKHLYLLSDRYLHFSVGHGDYLKAPVNVERKGKAGSVFDLTVFGAERMLCLVKHIFLLNLGQISPFKS